MAWHHAAATVFLKTLLLTGDDFGRLPAVNEAIERYHEAGALTQASLMVNEPHADEAARIARRHPALCVGLHLTLCDGRAARLSELTDPRGQLSPQPAAAGWRYALLPRLQASLRDEIEHQFTAFRALGFPPTYWDGHTHLHLHPTVLRLTLPIAQRHGFRATRLVREPGAWAPLPLVFRALSCAAVPGLRAHGITFADRVFGLRRTGHVTAEWVAELLATLPQGRSELYFHPGAERSPPPPAQLAALLRAASVRLSDSREG